MKRILPQTTMLLFLFLFSLAVFGQNNSPGVNKPGETNNNAFQQNHEMPQGFIEQSMVSDLYQVNQSPLAPDFSREIIFEENFDDLPPYELPPDWSKYTAYGYDFIDTWEGVARFFRQSSDDSPMILSTPELDLTTATKLTVDYNYTGYDLTLCRIDIGLMSDPQDPSTFQLIDVVTFDSLNVWFSHDTYLSAYSGNHYIALWQHGQYSDLCRVDNFVIIDDPVQADWPFFITNLEVVPGEEGAEEATVSWTNPTTQVDGDPLTELDSVCVYANGELVYTISDPVIGGDEEEVVLASPPGFFVFSVVAYNEAGESTPISSSQYWIGLDLPGPVTDLILTETDDNTANLSWVAPTVGQHGAYFDGVIDNYLIIRSDGVENTIDGEETTFTEVLETPGTYNYRVIGINSSGQGATSFSNAEAFYFNDFLLWEDFWVSVPALDWTIEGYGQTYTWQMSWWNFFGTAPDVMFYVNSWMSFDSISRMVSPTIDTEGQDALSLKFKQIQDWENSVYTFKVSTTSDGGSTWNDVYVLEVSEDIPAEDKLIVINNDDIGSEDFQFAFTFDGNSDNCNRFFIDDVRLYPASEIDITPVFLELPDIIKPGDLITPTAKIESYGYLETEYTTTLNFFNNENEAVYTSEVTSTLEGGGSEEITFDAWVAIEGEYLAELTVYAEGDENNNNDTLTQEFTVYYLTASRTLVICEEGTGTWCTYCPGAAIGLDELLVNQWPVAVVAYHSGDDYETETALSRLSYYQISGYPTVYFDGTSSVIGGDHTQSMYDFYWPVVEARLEVPAALEIDFENVVGDMNSNTITADIVIESASPINNDNIVLHAILTESEIPEEWQDQDILNFVQRVNYNGAGGTSIDLSDNEETVTVSFEVDDEWNWNHLELVVFVQDMETKEIFNGNKSSDFDPVSIIETESGFKVYPNPAQNYFRIDGDFEGRINVYDAYGKTVISVAKAGKHQAIDITKLKNGLYFIEIQNGNERILRKVLVNK